MSEATCGAESATRLLTRPRMSLRSSGLRSGHASSPRFLVRPRARRSFLFLFAVGACGTLGETPRPRRPHCCGHPACRFRKRHPGSGPAAKLNRPQNAVFACVPHANGFFSLLHAPGGIASADAVPFVRAVARTCTWTVHPFCRRLRPPAFEDYSIFSTLGPGIVADHRIQLHITKTLMMRPSSEPDGCVYISVKQECQAMFLQSRKNSLGSWPRPQCP